MLRLELIAMALLQGGVAGEGGPAPTGHSIEHDRADGDFHRAAPNSSARQAPGLAAARM